MNGMYPYKKRWLLLFIPLVLAIIICIIKVDKEYEDISENKYKPGDKIEYEGATYSVVKTEKVDDETAEKLYGSNEEFMFLYNNTYKDSGLIMVTIDIEGINSNIYSDLVNGCHLVAGYNGNGVSLLSDYVNTDLTEKKENRQIVLFFRILDNWLEEAENKLVLMDSIYPVQNNTYITLGE